MRRILMPLFIALAMLFAFGALAESNPIDPNFAAVREMTEQMNNGMLVSKGDISVTPVCTNELNFDTGNDWTVSFEGGTAPYRYRATVYRYESVGNHYAPVETFEGNTSDSSVGVHFDVLVPGKYAFMFTVSDASGSSDTKVEHQYDPCVLEADEDHPTLDQIVSDFVADCPEGSDYDRALWVYNKLCEPAVYDDTYARHGAEYVLIEHTGVCDSYSYAYEQLLNCLGIPCGRVTGDNHAWNIACLDGVWTQFDATWDTADAGSVAHWYFAVPEEMIRLDHDGYVGPESETCNYECTSYAENYFVREGIAVDWYTKSGYSADFEPVTALAERLWENAPALPYYIHYPEGGENSYIITASANYKTALIGKISAYLLSNDEYSVSYNTDTFTFSIEFLDGIFLPDGIKTVSAEMLENTDAIYVEIPDSCTAIEADAFSGMSRLVRIYVPASVTEIDAAAFEGLPETAVIVTPADSDAAAFCEANDIPCFS